MRTNPAPPLRGAIARAPVEHHRRLTEKEPGASWRKLDGQGAHITTITATRLLLLTMTRKSELLRSSCRARPSRSCAMPDFGPHATCGTAATLLRKHGLGRDVVELRLAHSEKDATVAACSAMELAADRKRALQCLAHRVEALAEGMNVIALRAA